MPHAGALLDLLQGTEILPVTFNAALKAGSADFC
jgi:hypothetical protein